MPFTKKNKNKNKTKQKPNKQAQKQDNKKIIKKSMVVYIFPQTNNVFFLKMIYYMVLFFNFFLFTMKLIIS
jgi:hypothetical protein